MIPLVLSHQSHSNQGRAAWVLATALAYVAVTWQVSAEAIIPLNTEAGRSIGFRTQVLLFLDDLIPSVFGKPLLHQ